MNKKTCASCKHFHSDYARSFEGICGDTATFAKVDRATTPAEAKCNGHEPIAPVEHKEFPDYIGTC